MPDYLKPGWDGLVSGLPQSDEELAEYRRRLAPGPKNVPYAPLGNGDWKHDGSTSAGLALPADALPPRQGDVLGNDYLISELERQAEGSQWMERNRRAKLAETLQPPTDTTGLSPQEVAAMDAAMRSAPKEIKGDLGPKTDETGRRQDARASMWERYRKLDKPTAPAAKPLVDPKFLSWLRK